MQGVLIYPLMGKAIARCVEKAEPSQASPISKDDLAHMNQEERNVVMFALQLGVRSKTLELSY